VYSSLSFTSLSPVLEQPLILGENRHLRPSQDVGADVVGLTVPACSGVGLLVSYQLGFHVGGLVQSADHDSEDHELLDNIGLGALDGGNQSADHDSEDHGTVSQQSSS